MVFAFFALSLLLFLFVPSTGFFFFAPSLAFVSYFFSPMQFALCGMGIGFFVDCFSVETVLGWYAFQGLLSSLLLLRIKQFLFEDLITTLPILSVIFLASCEIMELLGRVAVGCRFQRRPFLLWLLR